MKTAAFVLLWLAGSAAAIGVAWTGIAVVDSEVLDPPSMLALDEPGLDSPGGGSDEQALGLTLATTTTTNPAETVAEPSSTATAPALFSTAPQSTALQSAPLQSTPPTTRPPTTRSSDTVAAAPTTTASPTTSSPTTAAPAATTKTYMLRGGSTAISFSPSGAKVLWATPNPGFEVEISNSGPGIRVEFDSDDHRSRLEAWWSGGPQQEIRED